MKKFLMLLFACLLIQACYIPAFAASPVSSEEEYVVQADNNSEWAELQSVVIPFETPLYEGLTKNGTAKYWFEFTDIGKVTVSPGSAVKFKERSTKLELVKWYNASKDTYKYSTRQLRDKKGKIPNINLTELF